MDESDPNDLDGVLERLRAHHPPPAEVDIETRELAGQPEVKQAVKERRRLEEMPDPEAPAPVEITSDTGTRLVQAKAAATYVAPVEITLPEAPRMPSGPVRLQGDIDPRHRETVRIKHKGAEPGGRARSGPDESAGAEDAQQNAMGAVNEEGTYDAPASGAKVADPASRRGIRARGVLVGTAIVFVAGVVATMVALKRPEPPKDTAASASPTQTGAPPSVKSAAAVETSSAPPVASATPSATPSEAAPIATAPAPSAPAASTGERPAPKAPLQPSVPAVTSAPSAAPAPSTAPSVTPSGTATTSPTAAPVMPHTAPPPSAPPAAPSASSAPTAAPRSDTITKPAGGTKLED